MTGYRKAEQAQTNQSETWLPDHDPNPKVGAVLLRDAPEDVERLAAALLAEEDKGHMALLGTDDRVDAKGYPVRVDYTGIDREVARGIIERLRADR